MRPLANWDEAAFDRSLGNYFQFKGLFFLIQALLPVFANPASIVLNTSINAPIGMPNTSIYAASKAALLSLARTLSAELFSRGIRVNAVSPASDRDPAFCASSDCRTTLSRQFPISLKTQVPVGRFGVPAEVARAIVSFASDESAFTVGSELVIGGGMSNL